MRIAVAGMGKTGLLLAAHYACGGYTVVDVDVNLSVATLTDEGVEPLPDEVHLAGYLPPFASSGALRATTEYAEVIPGADTVVMTVSLVADNESRPGFRAMDGATRSMAAHPAPGTLVSYETTPPVGTTRGRYKPLIEEISGPIEGRGFDAVFSPERILTGQVFADLARYPKPVGGLNEAGEARGAPFYEAILSFGERDDLPRPNGVWLMGGAEAAGMTRLAETTYRDANIDLANQFTHYADATDINVVHVIEACNFQPYSHIHRPGIAVGGHRIPVYPCLYPTDGPDATIVSAARAVNADMPVYAVSRASVLLGSLEGLRVVVPGATYRGGVKETAFSGVFDVVDALRKVGVQVSVHDPLYVDDESATFGWGAYHLGEPVDVAIIRADHTVCRNLVPADLSGVRLLVNGRTITSSEAWAGTLRITVGGGSAPAC